MSQDRKVLVRKKASPNAVLSEKEVRGMAELEEGSHFGMQKRFVLVAISYQDLMVLLKKIKERTRAETLTEAMSIVWFDPVLKENHESDIELLVDILRARMDGSLIKAVDIDDLYLGINTQKEPERKK